jgi:RNA polymerase sigma-70 factor (sigma-E family)
VSVVDEDGRADFEAWVRSAQSRLVEAAFLMSGDAYHAQDLVQEALIKVAARWERLRDQDPHAYARKILYRDHISWWRKRRDVPFDVLPEVAQRDQSESRVDDLLMSAALARLTRKQRAVLVLRYFEDMSEHQTADTLGVSVGTVKSQCAAALARLRRVAPELKAFEVGEASDV